MNELIPAAVILAGPLLLLAPIVYALRPQAGRRWLSLHPVPARQVIARLGREARQGVIPAGPFGDTTRPPAWTVPPAYATADRDMTGAFPVVRAAA